MATCVTKSSEGTQSHRDTRELWCAGQRWLWAGGCPAQRGGGQGSLTPQPARRKGAHVARMQRAAPSSWGDPVPVRWRRPGKLNLPAPQPHQRPGASLSFTPALWRLKLGLLVSENRHQPRVCPAEQCHSVGHWVQMERAGRQAPRLGAGAAAEPCQEGRLGWGLPLPDIPSFGSWSSDSFSPMVFLFFTLFFS